MSNARTIRWFWPALAAAAVVAVALGYGLGNLFHDRSGPPATAHATVLEPARAIESFDLVDHHEQPFTLARLRGQWTFVFFGFTHCPDICPTTMATLGDAIDRMRAATGDPVAVAFVTVDPDRDTPEQLARYVPFFHPDFLGVTGGDEALASFARQLGAVYMRTEMPDGSNYTMDHSSGLLLINPDGALRAFFSAPHDSEVLAVDFERIASQS